MMKRLVVLLAIGGAALGALGIACGGKEKPPLVPDHTEEFRVELEPDAGTGPAAPTAPAPAKK